jgi:hypothetical protein
MLFVTENVVPQMTVIPSRYRSALGGRVLWAFVVFIAFGAALPGCGRDERARIPEDRFVQIYADMLYVAELHRANPEARRHATDSLLRAGGTDSAAVARTMAWYAAHQEEFPAMYDRVIRRLERRSGQAAPASD